MNLLPTTAGTWYAINQPWRTKGLVKLWSISLEVQISIWLVLLFQAQNIFYYRGVAPRCSLATELYLRIACCVLS